MYDFSSNTLPQIRDGNTISCGQWLRRGLPKLQTNVVVPKSRKLELVGYTKTNGDCFMVSYVEFDDDDEEDGMFLIGTRNMSLLARDIAHLQTNKDKYTTQVRMGTLFFNQLAKLDRKELEELKRDLNGNTWIAEYLSQDNLVHYDEARLVFHSVVHNSSGNIKADTAKIFQRYGLHTVPCQSFGTFILEESELEAKIEEVRKNCLLQPLSQTQEGLVLQFIDKQE